MSENINKLRWRCRRGTRELDLMLIRYLDTAYPSADPDEQQAFLKMLEFEDTELMRYLMGEQMPVDESLSGLVLSIRSLPV